MVGDQERMMTEFQAAMARLQVLGQNTKKMIDCSDVIPVPKSLPKGHKIQFPPKLSSADLELKARHARFTFGGK